MFGPCRGFFGCKGSKNDVIPVIPINKFRHLVQIQVPNLFIPDGGGGGEYGWSDVATVWAYIQTFNPGTGGNRSQFEEAQLRERRQWIITIRYDPVHLDTSMRLLFNGHILEIDSIVNVNEVDWEIQLYCTEDGDFNGL